MKPRMKAKHYFYIVSTAAALGLLFADMPGLAGLLVTVSLVMEIVATARSGKQSNDGMH